ncbi:MAG: phosphatase PAP2 family protein [bacterium]|nr:phosphatase PAP2 family protein [bacterium]
MKKINKVIMSILFLVFCIIAVLVHFGLTGSFDTTIYKFVIGFKSDTLTKVLLFITDLASVKGVVALCVISLIGLFWKYYKSLFLVLNVVVSTIFNVVFKNIMMVPRPNILRLAEETGYSFPSGHSMASVAFYGFVIYLVLSSKMNKCLKIIISSLLVILIFVIGFSRVYLGVHNASDVIAGHALGTALLFADIMIFKKKGLVE